MSFRSEELLEKKKKKRKRKGKMPKNYNPAVDPDPERWLLRRERSTWKGRRKNKNKDIGKWDMHNGKSANEVNAIHIIYIMRCYLIKIPIFEKLELGRGVWSKEFTLGFF